MEPQNVKLLLLEDNEADVALIQRVLHRSGTKFDITVVSDQNSFLSAIQNTEFDIILSDNYLPQFDATAAIELMGQNNINTPLILVTGTVSEGFAISMIKTGACDYILKDRLQRLPSAILNAIERHILKTNQKKALDDLAKNEALLRAIFDNTEVGYILVDSSLNIILFNQSAQKYALDYMPRPLENGKQVVNFFKPERQAFVNNLLQKTLSGSAHTYDISYPQSDGTDKWFYISFRPQLDGEERVTGIVMSATDITERKIAELSGTPRSGSYS